MVGKDWIPNYTVIIKQYLSGVPFCFSAFDGNRHEKLLHPSQERWPVEDPSGLLFTSKLFSNAMFKHYDWPCKPGWRFVLWLCRNLLVTLEEMPVSWRRTLRSSSTKHSSGTRWDSTFYIAAILQISHQKALLQLNCKKLYWSKVQDPSKEFK